MEKKYYYSNDPAENKEYIDFIIEKANISDNSRFSDEEKRFYLSGFAAGYIKKEEDDDDWKKKFEEY